ncbi:uncharacterized protein N7446_005284 [Penicillium canescens]|uniref:Uncharacterized protein n=1 Tax=Penicillium canescens TaxID=5083 RepID=A0AAD6N7M7_PENCN|nr:uncharacterized protein N7446_005284 [Penicillium canescens]KAJ6038479.1 hypothetical protein N7460_008250 [Penicillium canescens]KAJ6068247.1 hypothetical protein N7446_005284 [Penicillium canescens]
MIIGGVLAPTECFGLLVLQIRTSLGFHMSSPEAPWGRGVADRLAGQLNIESSETLTGLNYIIDVSPTYANSAIAANSFFWSWLGAGLPIFALRMLKILGAPWAMTLLGCLTAVYFPVPMAFSSMDERSDHGVNSA